MMTGVRPQHYENPLQVIARQIRVSGYDRAAGLLSALLIMSSVVVLSMFAIWIADQSWPKQVEPSKPDVWERAPGGGSRGVETPVLEDPKDEELPTADELPLQEVIPAITDAISTRAADLDAFQPKRIGDGPGPRKTGPDGPDGPDEGDRIPRWERWEIQYAAHSTDVYARQLDYFGVELGAVGGSVQNLDLASAFTSGQPRRTSKTASEETRLYMTWQNGSLLEADRELLAQAGIPTTGRIVLQLYPAEIEAQLAKLESEHAGQRDARSIKKTIFGVRPAGSGYEFFVIDQRYRAFVK